MDLLNFYFLLSSLQLGVCYDASNLPDSIKELMNDLKNCGFIYRDKRDRNQYYPTRLATSLGSMKAQGIIGSATTLTTSDNSVAAPLNPLNSSLDSNETDATPDHFIMLETNYNVYAYTNSRLHISILNLFLTLKCRFSNMVIAHLDRQSIRRALTKGITAEQILQYLTAHAHPLMLKRTPVLPVTVVDQIRLWAIEKNRLYDQAGN
jgi:transcription initiation factor TFIIH subunit 4